MLFKTVIETLFVTVLFYTVLRPLRSKKFLRIAWSIIAVVLLAKALEAMGFLAVSWIIERAGVLLPILFVVLFQKCFSVLRFTSLVKKCIRNARKSGPGRCSNTCFQKKSDNNRSSKSQKLKKGCSMMMMMRYVKI